MKYITYFLSIVGEGNFINYYTWINYTISYDKFLQLPTLLQLGIINHYLTIKHGIVITFTIFNVLVNKIENDHVSPREILLNGVEYDTGIVATAHIQYTPSTKLPNDECLIAVTNSIKHIISDNPF
ncbi:hypothetical protein M0Q97_13825 [Candidatus Dojkabacteria bacterium]|jgi:hypothetical protein|nr:hypothetical protein [Candidatus Dojkabacteria bacterium]